MLVFKRNNRGMPAVRVPRPRGVALQAAGLERDTGRFRAKATGLEHRPYMQWIHPDVAKIPTPRHKHECVFECRLPINL